MLRSVCQHYQKKGMFSSKCKTCGQPKEGCGAWLNEKKPDALVKLCDSSSAPPTAKVDELIAAGINLRHKVRVKRDLIVATLNTCGGVGGGRAVRKWPRVRVEGREEESASNDDSIKPS